MLRTYVGQELPLFALASNFHRYYIHLLAQWIRGQVLEVGAGLGTLTRLLLECDIESLFACEPDPKLYDVLRKELGGRATVVNGGIKDVPSRNSRFDTIVYVDVLEHVDDDRGEVRAAAKRLAGSGCLLIGGPAHPGLSSPFDASVGHRRRYDRGMIEALVAGCPGLKLEQFAYFDCVGAVLSLGNRWISRQPMPSPAQLRFWNDIILPLSRRLDPLIGHSFGKSFIAVARRK